MRHNVKICGRFNDAYLSVMPALSFLYSDYKQLNKFKMKTKSIVLVDYYTKKEIKTLFNREITSIEEENKNQRNDKFWIFRENSELISEYEIVDFSFVGVWKDIMQFIGYINEHKPTKTISKKVRISVRF